MTFSRILTISLMVTAVSCESERPSEGSAAPEEVPTKVESPEYKEVWMMQGWGGYMGVMLGLKDNDFDYYFHSDVGSHGNPTPLTGTYTRNEKGIKLIIPKEHADVDLYAKEWQFVNDKGALMLASLDDLKAGRDSGRWLRKVNLSAFKKYYDPNNPFLLQMNPHLELEFANQTEKTEQGGAYEPATAPQLKPSSNDNATPKSKLAPR